MSRGTNVVFQKCPLELMVFEKMSYTQSPYPLHLEGQHFISFMLKIFKISRTLFFIAPARLRQS